MNEVISLDFVYVDGYDGDLYPIGKYIEYIILL